MPSLTIRHANGSTDTIPQTVRTEIKREIGKMRRGRLTVERSLAQSANLEAKSDVIELPNDDNLRLVDIETGGSTHTLVGYSFEWDANTVTPTDGGTLKTGDDDTLITDFVNDVSTWSAGTITQQATGLSFVFNHAQPHEAIRRIEKNVPGEIQFRDEGVVDYTSRLGSDRSGSVELSASAGTIEDTIQITERGRKLDGTHIRVLGAHEGEAQLFANLVPSGDPQSYENDVRYSTTRWSFSSDTEWNRFSNKDVTDQDTIEEEAAELGEELKESLVEAKAIVSDVDLNVGDTVQVVKSDADLNRDMRVHRITEIQQGATETAEVLLSTRTTLRTDEDDDLKDIQRFNSGFQGASVVVQGGGSRQPVDSSNNAEIPFYYPDNSFENKAELFVRGLNYRHYSTPNNHKHTIDVSSEASSEPDEMQTLFINSTSNDNISGGNWQDFGSTAFGSDNNQANLFYANISFDSVATNGQLQMRVYNSNDGRDYPMSLSGTQEYPEIFNPSGSFDGQTVTLSILVPEREVDNGDIMKIQLRSQNSLDAEIDTNTQLTQVGNHLHDIDDTSETEVGVTPGIQETANTPTNVDVVVNNSTVASNIGSGTFETTVDISNDLTNGDWNLIELTSDDLGHIQAGVNVNAYQQIGQN